MSAASRVDLVESKARGEVVRPCGRLWTESRSMLKSLAGSGQKANMLRSLLHLRNNCVTLNKICPRMEMDSKNGGLRCNK